MPGGRRSKEMAEIEAKGENRTLLMLWSVWTPTHHVWLSLSIPLKHSHTHTFTHYSTDGGEYFLVAMAAWQQWLALWGKPIGRNHNKRDSGRRRERAARQVVSWINKITSTPSCLTFFHKKWSPQISIYRILTPGKCKNNQVMELILYFSMVMLFKSN